MFEGMTDKGRYNREAPARIFHSSAGSNPNFQRKPHVEKPYKSKPKRQTPLNHLPKEFHGRSFSRNLYLTSRSQIFEKKKKKSVLKKVRKTTLWESETKSPREGLKIDRLTQQRHGVRSRWHCLGHHIQEHSEGQEDGYPCKRGSFDQLIIANPITKRN